MKKLRVLQLTDAFGGEFDLYSEQLEISIDGKHISETCYFLTDGNMLVDIDKDIDIENAHIKKAIELGAIVKTMYYAEDGMFSHNIDNFEAKGMWDGIEYGEEHGGVFELEDDSIRYERYVSLVKEKIEGDGYEVIEKENAIKIVKETPLEDLAKLLISKQRYKECGSICYLDLENGVIKVDEDTCKLSETDIVIAELYKEDMPGGCIVNGLYNYEYHFCIVSSDLQLDGFREAVEEFYSES